MKGKFLVAAAAVSLCLLVTAGCSSDAELSDNTATPPAQVSTEQTPAPSADISAPEPDVQLEPASADLSKAPPYLHVTYDGESLDIRGWNWEWTVQNPDGTTLTLEPDWATAYPLDWVDTMDTLIKTDAQTLELSFVVEPTAVTACLDPLSGEFSRDAEVKNGNILSLVDDAEGVVYTIHAEWNDVQGYSGHSCYALCVKSS